MHINDLIFANICLAGQAPVRMLTMRMIIMTIMIMSMMMMMIMVIMMMRGVGVERTPTDLV